MRTKDDETETEIREGGSGESGSIVSLRLAVMLLSIGVLLALTVLAKLLSEALK